jgi:hypothetical protein
MKERLLMGSMQVLAFVLAPLAAPGRLARVKRYVREARDGYRLARAHFPERGAAQ